MSILSINSYNFLIDAIDSNPNNYACAYPLMSEMPRRMNNNPRHTKAQKTPPFKTLHAGAQKFHKPHDWE